MDIHEYIKHYTQSLTSTPETEVQSQADVPGAETGRHM